MASQYDHDANPYNRQGTAIDRCRACDTVAVAIVGAAGNVEWRHAS